MTMPTYLFKDGGEFFINQVRLYKLLHTQLNKEKEH